MFAFLFGIIIGALTNIPAGPINTAVVTRGLSGRFHRGMAVGVGAAFMDALYCAAAMFGFSLILDLPIVSTIFQFVGFGLLVGLGIHNVRKKHKPLIHDVAPEKVGVHGPFFIGVLLYLANPTFLAYWVAVSGVLQSHHLIGTNTFSNIMFSTGVGIGTALWFYILLRFLSARKAAIKPHFIVLVHRLGGVTLLGFAAYLGWRIVTLTNWPQFVSMFSPGQ